MGAPVPNDVRLKGPFRPMRFEATIADCVVSEGEIPKELTGGFYRCGPTWKRPTAQGTIPLLALDGMVQGLVFHDGRADFTNRWIRTPKYVLEEQLGRGVFEYTDGEFGDWRTWGYANTIENELTKGVPQGPNNVNVYPFNGELVTSGEQGGPPISLDPVTLETKGIVSWAPQLSPGFITAKSAEDCSFTAHPKWDSETGELYGWTFREEPPYVTLHWVKPGEPVRSREVWDAPYSALAHDIWLTEKYVVMPFQPLYASQKRIDAGESVFGWDPELPIVIGLILRSDINAEIRWITADIEPEYVMHTLAANTNGSTITLDAPIFDRPPLPFEHEFAKGDQVALFYSIAKSTPGRWTIDLDKGTVKTERLSDRLAELPKVDQRLYGKGYEWGYMIGGDGKREGMSMSSLVALNARTGAEHVYRIRHDNPVAVLEPTFAPRSPEAPEGDGYVIVPVSKWAENAGEYLIFDTYDITAGPIARIEIPFMLGWTPHGHWMDLN